MLKFHQITFTSIPEEDSMTGKVNRDNAINK